MTLWASLALGVGCAATALAGSWLLTRIWPALGRAWAYRTAVLASCALGLALWLAQRPLSPVAPWAALVGALAGGLLATGLRMGLWENSFAPPPEVAAEVLMRHRAAFSQFAPEPAAKRPLALLMAAVSLLLSAPVWLIIALSIWCEDPGPILFVKNSVGRGGVTFRQLKFRSMVHGAEARTGPIPTYLGDPRTLRVGRFLRRSGLDELPQLVNILRGEMSFVGPRPLRTVVIHAYLKEMPQFVERHRVRPGITGLSQVRAGYEVKPLERLHYDQLYISDMSLRHDLTIVAQTLRVVARSIVQGDSAPSPMHF